MAAVQPIRGGDTILSIPIATVLTQEKALSSPFGQILSARVQEDHSDSKRQNDESSSLLIILSFMIQQRLDPSSEFFGYLRSCPCSFEQFPMWWDDDEIEPLLRGTPLVPAIRARKELIMNLQEQFVISMAPAAAELQELAHVELRWFTYRNFLWAYSVFFSRAFPAKLANSQGFGILLPFADILNHKFRTPVTWVQREDSQTIEFVAEDGFSADIDDQVFNNYGAKSNGEWLFGYGFAELDNPKDFVPLFPKSGQVTSQRMESLMNDQREEDCSTQTFYLRADAISSDGYLQFPSELLDHFKTQLMTPAGEAPGGRFELDLEVLKALKCLLWRKINAMYAHSPRSSYEGQKQILLQNDTLTQKERNSIIYTTGQARILFAAYDSVHRAIVDAYIKATKVPITIDALLSTRLDSAVLFGKVLAELPWLQERIEEFTDSCGGESVCLIVYTAITFQEDKFKFRWMESVDVQIEGEEQLQDYCDMYAVLQLLSEQFDILPLKNLLEKIPVELFVRLAAVCEERMVEVYTADSHAPVLAVVLEENWLSRADREAGETPNCFVEADCETAELKLISLGISPKLL
eukprot:TRINITY_DN5378_c0_g2_i1.p1 TRINITY_DN5378_c0_g2~~TRINITY_DN5378_c0_g2_i1.p1  ORF type:complete len:637 (+),score=153.23 TRINITY_DN5378_c0_g2_i1:173-1912(+)